MNIDELKAKAEEALGDKGCSWDEDRTFQEMRSLAEGVLELIAKFKDALGICPMCSGPSDIVLGVYPCPAGKTYKSYTRNCKDAQCAHHWLPLEAETILDYKLFLDSLSLLAALKEKDARIQKLENQFRNSFIYAYEDTCDRYYLNVLDDILPGWHDGAETVSADEESKKD
jgi:hypothetical protein